MSKKCELTGKIPMKGHNVSHANNKTKRRFLPNLKKVKFTSEILKRNLRLNVSNAATFDATAKSAESLWEKELQKIKINTNDKALATKFYTSLYRTCLAPVVHSDASGAYQTHHNLQKKFIKGKEKYTVFSQWDVFRALNPLFTITQTDRLPDMINSMLQLYEDNGLLPVWDLST